MAVISSTDTERRPQESWGEWVERLCRARGLRLSFVAAQLGLSESTFRNVRSGERELKPSEAATLATIVGVEPADLLPGGDS